MSLVVQKYGGTSVGSVDRIKAVADNIGRWVAQGHKMVIVVSAMGHETDRLIDLAYELHDQPPQREMDMLLTTGERISTALLSIALHAKGIRAISLTGSQSGILTDETHGNARIKRITGERIQKGLNDGCVVIVAGFQGVNPETKEITTLGRGGSDVTGVALAAALGAELCEIYTDVDGVYTADPRRVAGARPLAIVSWEEMSELACQGAGVLHPRAAHMADRKGMPVVVRSSFHWDNPGTVVKGRANMESAVVTAVTHQDQLAMIDLRVNGAKGQPTWLSKITGWLWKEGCAPLIAQQQVDAQGTNLRLMAPMKLMVRLEEFIQGFVSEAGFTMTSRSQKDLAGISLIGKGLLQNPELVGQVLAKLPCTPAHVEVRNHAIVLAVSAPELDQSLSALHDMIVQ